MARKKSAPKAKGKPRPRKSAKPAARPAGAGGTRLYTLEVFLFSGPITEAFAKKNPAVSRTIQVRGDQTLQDLHRAIFRAFDREEEHLYEFQFGKGPMDPQGTRYVLPAGGESGDDGGARIFGRVDQTTLDDLGLAEGDVFGYWFDFGDDWWHQVNVEKVEEPALPGRYPKVVKRVGESPPQYPDEDE